jgi:hypothetical protein
MSYDQIDATRDAVIRRIRSALKARSGKSWSVTGGRGTAWGWITIKSPPARALNQYGSMTDAEALELGQLLGLGHACHLQGVSIAAYSDYRQEYIQRAEGKPVTVVGQPGYWD